MSVLLYGKEYTVTVIVAEVQNVLSAMIDQWARNKEHYYSVSHMRKRDNARIVTVVNERNKAEVDVFYVVLPAGADEFGEHFTNPPAIELYGVEDRIHWHQLTKQFNELYLELISDTEVRIIDPDNDE